MKKKPSSWKSFKQWCHAHPFKFAFFMWATALVCSASLDRGIEVQIASLLLLCAAFVLVCSYDMIRMGLMSLSLATLIAMPSKAQERQPEAGGVAIGVTVIVIGGVAYYFLTKTCQKLFPKPPTKTNELYAAGTPTDCAASFSYQSPHSCRLPDPSLAGYESAPTVIEIEVEGGTYPRVVEIRKSQSQAVGYFGFDEAIATHGIRLSERPGECYYGLNGKPADGAQVPISFDASDNSVAIGRGELSKFTIERSSDFETWETLASMSLTYGQMAIVVDASDGSQMFYRVR